MSRCRVEGVYLKYGLGYVFPHSAVTRICPEPYTARLGLSPQKRGAHETHGRHVKPHFSVRNTLGLSWRLPRQGSTRASLLFRALCKDYTLLV